MTPSTTTPQAPSLRGKTVAVQVRGRSTCPAVLRECHLETRGGRLFLVGVSMPAQNGVPEWTDGVRRAIAWDAIEEYCLFDAPADYYAKAKNVATPAAAPPADMPMFESPQSSEGFPVEPSGIHLEPEMPLEVGSTVLSYSQGRWWRAEVVALEENDGVRIHFPGWDAKWDLTVPKTELQVDLSGSIEAEPME
ncbi:MAG: hypothetical protein HY289_15825 [Planctomycetes bacterium]|nr:hypothetical protein [Planctomycetota bacterium]